MISFIALLLATASLAVAKEFFDDYAIIIDAGSTGSRCFVYHVTIDMHSHRNISSHPCGKVVPGLSSFVDHPEDIGDYFSPLLSLAAERIPSAAQFGTSVFIKGTAGMRLVSEAQQAILWKHVVNDINRRPAMPFVIASDHVGTIDGRAEAFFAVLASNYIAGSIDGNLHPMAGHPLLGALDMGGSSTQLIFYNGTLDARKLHADDFWAHSWLNYGAIRVRERVLDYLLSQQDGSAPEVQNHCGFRNHMEGREATNGNTSYTFIGTGQSEKCIAAIEKMLWPTAVTSHGTSLPIDDIVHPDVHGNHFYAMSVYFFALDCVREMGPMELEHWPAPSIEEAKHAAVAFCNMDWHQLEAAFLGANRHQWTEPEQLKDRCFEALYILTLLEKGFGFDRHARHITYALEVGGKEVEWTLGFALAEVDFSPSLFAAEQRTEDQGLDLHHLVATQSTATRQLHDVALTLRGGIRSVVSTLMDVIEKSRHMLRRFTGRAGRVLWELWNKRQ